MGYRRTTLRHDDLTRIGGEAWVTIAAAAVLAHRQSDSTIRRWIAAGLLDTQVGVNGKTLVRAAQVLEVEAAVAVPVEGRNRVHHMAG